jgi:outer membrane protein assembly factor BamA
VDSTGWRPQVAVQGAYVFDNAYWGAGIAPERGTRTRLSAYASVLPDQQFLSLYADYRNYLKFARRYIFANRFYGAASFGRDPERYYLGGEDVRGYQYGEFFDSPGTNAVVISSELRSPFVDHLKIAFPLPFDLTDIRGVTFADWGLIWNNRKLPVLYDVQNARLQDLKLGIGAGIRFQISYFAIKLDYGWPVSALSIDPSTDKERARSGSWYFSLGVDF